MQQQKSIAWLVYQHDPDREENELIYVAIGTRSDAKIEIGNKYCAKVLSFQEYNAENGGEIHDYVEYIQNYNEYTQSYFDNLTIEPWFGDRPRSGGGTLAEFLRLEWEPIIEPICDCKLCN